MMADRLSRLFYRRDVVRVAKALLGQRLVRVDRGGRMAGLIVEVEAYLGIPDQAAHTYRARRTQRNASMWRDGGHVYVYFTYGMHHCMNVVAGHEGKPVAVLLRALEPQEGLGRMWRYRSTARRDTDLCSGPGKLCKAMNIDRTLDGSDLVTSESFFIERMRARSYPSSRVVSAPRIGVDYAGSWADKLLRFYIRDNPHVSRV